VTVGVDCAVELAVPPINRKGARRKCVSSGNVDADSTYDLRFLLIVVDPCGHVLFDQRLSDRQEPIVGTNKVHGTIKLESIHGTIRHPVRAQDRCSTSALHEEGLMIRVCTEILMEDEYVVQTEKSHSACTGSFYYKRIRRERTADARGNKNQTEPEVYTKDREARRLITNGGETRSRR
jgi:hypothetical protein